MKTTDGHNNNASTWPEDWTSCNNGKCQCKQVSARDYPVCTVTAGDWGNTWPALRIEGGSFDQRVVPYVEMDACGRVSEELAQKNARLIAKAPAMLRALELLLKAQVFRSEGKETTARIKEFQALDAANEIIKYVRGTE